MALEPLSFLNQGSDLVWGMFVDGLLRLPLWAQFAVNTGMQALQAVIEDNLIRPTDTFREMVSGMKVWFVDPGDPKAKDGLIAMEVVMKEWMKPNIGGITISPTVERQGRSVDNSENMIITQRDKSSITEALQEYVSDNSAPHPRTWHIEGYLTASVPIVDQTMGIIKPTLILQQALLDAYAQARKPVLFRSGLCQMPTQVMIDDYSIERQTEGNQAYSISIDLREWVVYDIPITIAKQNVEDAITDATSTTSTTRSVTPAAKPQVQNAVGQRDMSLRGLFRGVNVGPVTNSPLPPVPWR